MRTRAWPLEFADVAGLWPCCRDGGLVTSVNWSRWGHGGLASVGGGVGLHCFVEDYRFEVGWRRPWVGLLRAKAAGVVTGPDFSVPWGSPRELGEWQAWRSGVVSAWWQSQGVCVLPVLIWSDVVPRQCIDVGSWVAVRGPQRGQDLARWERGFLRACEAVQPAGVLVFGDGTAAAECLGGAGEVWQINTHGGAAERLPARLKLDRKGAEYGRQR